MKTKGLFILVFVFFLFLFSAGSIAQHQEIKPEQGAGRPGGLGLSPGGGGALGPGPIFTFPGTPDSGSGGAAGGSGGPPPPLFISSDLIGAIIKSDTTNGFLSEEGEVFYSMYENFVFNQYLRPTIDDFLARINRRGIEFVSLPKLTMTDAEAMRALMKLEMETVNTVERKLLGDLGKLQPYNVDSKVQIERKQVEVARAEVMVRNIATQARQESQQNHWTRAPASDESGGGKTYRFNEGEAFRQLNHIYNTNNWGGN